MLLLSERIEDDFEYYNNPSLHLSKFQIVGNLMPWLISYEVKWKWHWRLNITR